MPLDLLDIKRAIEDGEFVPHFQPMVDLRTGALQAFELLARWHRAGVECIPPDEFIPVAERDGWIDELTETLLKQGFAAMADVPVTVGLSINVSPIQLQNRNLPSRIHRIATQHGFPLQRLTIEITESALARDAGSAREIVALFKDMGGKLALDDFGTGYSSLSQLQSLPFDELKVDRSFVRSMIERRDSRKIVAAVVGLGQSLGMTTAAEGIETEEEAEMLRWLGCELGQGWHFGRPTPAAGLAAIISQFSQKEPASPPQEGPGRVSFSSLDRLPAQRLAQLQAVYDGAPVGLAFLDRNMRYVNLNRRLANMNGHPMAAHLGRTVAEMIPEMFPIVAPFIRRALQGEAIDGVEVTKPAPGINEGKTLLLSYQPARDEAGEVVGVSVAMVDLTPIKQAQQAREESQEHFRYMIEQMPQIPWVIDPEGRALDVSQRWLQITGMKDAEWRGFGWLDALHPNDRQPTLDAMALSFRTGDPIDLVYRVRSSETSVWKPMRSRGSARTGPAGNIICWYGYLEPAEETSPSLTAAR